MKTIFFDKSWRKSNFPIAVFSSESHEAINVIDIRLDWVEEAINDWYFTIGSLTTVKLANSYSVVQAFRWNHIWSASYNLKDEQEAELFKKWASMFFWLRDLWEVLNFSSWKATILDNELWDLEDLWDEQIPIESEVQPDVKRIGRLKKIKELRNEDTWMNVLKRFHNEIAINKLWKKEQSEVDFLDPDIDLWRKNELIEAFSNIDWTVLETLKANEIDPLAFKRYLQNIWLNVKDVEDNPKWLLAVFKASFFREFWT